MTIVLAFFALSNLNGNGVADHPRKDPAVTHGKYSPTPAETSDPTVSAEIGNTSNIEHDSPADIRAVVVQPRDNLALIFQREGLSARELQTVLESDQLAERLTHIFPGQKLIFERGEDGALLRLAYSPRPLQSLVFTRHGTSFEVEQIDHPPEIEIKLFRGLIDHSLFIASQRIGLDDETTMRLAQIFQWDIDFVLDIRKGDEFALVVEELYLRGDFVGYRNILAAKFVNQSDSYLAFRYVDREGVAGYFNPNGESMKKAFLRAPLEFTRISSNFNMKRVHPLWNRTMPHRGIDYVAPVGTPVLAAGTGQVRVAGHTNANGNYVVIGHGSEFETKYLHLSKFGPLTKRGQRVNQGDIIGYVGSTGWATGPHLHYEFLVNGKHRNPRTVPLPKSNPINKGEFKRFQTHMQPTLALLENHKSPDLLTAVTD
ncbi:MAG: peptidoglycan DD-metalloendopeptidase family protein [Pseudomonadota bacterium]|nr:peptidoglycan DD-metalloendopeptidase family protein [Pseudomonadota bacterium]